jgi:O-antigen ligase
MRKLLWLCLLTLVPGLILRINVGGPGILPVDILGIVFAVFWCGRVALYERKVPKTYLFGSGFLFLFVALMSFLWNAWTLESIQAMVLSFSYWIRLFVAFVCGVAAIEMFAQQKDRDAFYTRFLWLTGSILALGFLQFFVFPDLDLISTEGGWDPHLGRLLGTWMDPNLLAGFMSFMLPVACGEVYRKARTKQKMFALSIFLLLLLGLFLTYSRSGYLAGLIALGSFLLVHDKKILVVAFFVAVLGISADERSQKRVEELTNTVGSIVMSSSSEIDPTANLRIQSWMNSLQLFYKHPVLGIGYNTYRYKAAEEGIVQEYYFSSGGSDSSHLTILITTGILGMFCFFWFYFKIVFSGIQNYFRHDDIRGLGMSAGFVGLFFHAFFVNSMLFPFIFIPAMIFVGIHEARTADFLNAQK